jgi:hypothetical protein
LIRRAHIRRNTHSEVVESMNYRDARKLASEAASWLLAQPEVKAVGVVRNLNGNRFKGIPINWMLQIACTNELSEKTRERIEKRLPEVPIDWSTGVPAEA